MSWSALVKAAVIALTAWFAISAIMRYSRRHNAETRMWSLLLLGCCLNFLAFWIIAVSIGGSAQLGEVRAGRYFLGDHGNLTEVRSWIYWYSWVHTGSLALTFPLWLVAEVIVRSREEDDDSTTSGLRGRGAV